MMTNTLEWPRVAHIVAELDDEPLDEFDPARVVVEPWVSPSRRPAGGKRRFGFALPRALAFAARLMTLVVLGACATTGATYRSGVGDAFPEAPPYYAGAPIEAMRRDTSAIGHLPIAYQRGASQLPMFDPRNGDGSPIDLLMRDMDRHLEQLRVSERLVEGQRVSAVAHRATTHPPDVRFGCETANNQPDGDCIDRDGALGRGRLPMKLSVGRPDEEWISWNREIMDDCGVSRTLVITLEVGQYLTRQRGWRGRKSVDLGTGYTTSLPWMTSLETPVTVLQLTGALVDRDGRALRIGAEGFYARPTRLLVSAVGGQELITDDDIRAVRETRRADLPGSPFAWQVALDELVSNLTGRPVK